MARKHRHEEHENHEAWAIPYGDLITLLLAFFVVMYAISTVNEGKYRALSDSLSAAFKGTPTTPDPISIGERVLTARDGETSIAPDDKLIGTTLAPVSKKAEQRPPQLNDQGMSKMDEIVGQVEAAMAEQIQGQVLKVRRNGTGVEIEISTDSLFPSGSASMTAQSIPIMEKLADTLKSLPYAMRVEGHTDNRPISTTQFPSNWELSAARAATVVHLFTQRGVDPSRLAVIGLGEFRPQQDNATEAGRNANRRVRVIILSDGDHPEDDKAIEAVAEEARNAGTGAMVTTTPAAAPTAANATP
jgi:chemotaxis protein MotB